MNTLPKLMAEFGTGQIPLARCAHIFGLGTDEAAKRALFDLPRFTAVALAALVPYKPRVASFDPPSHKHLP